MDLTNKKQKTGAVRKNLKEKEERSVAVAQVSAEASRRQSVAEDSEAGGSASASEWSMSSMSECSVALERRPPSYWTAKLERARIRANSNKRRRDVDVGSEPATSEDEEAPSKVMVAKGGVARGRGRPPSTGKYVGLSKAQADLKALRKEEERRKAEEEVAARMAILKANQVAAPVPISSEDESELASDLVKQVGTAADAIVSIAQRSGNLKGTFIKALKEAVVSIKGAVEQLQRRTATEETVMLQADNARLRKEVGQLRKEFLDFKSRSAAKEDLPQTTITESQATSSPCNDGRQQEELVRSIMMQVGGMMNARFEGLEKRLLPEERVRPPLAADKRNVAASAPVREGTTAAEAAQPTSQPAKANKKKKKTMAAREAAGASHTQPSNPPPASGTTKEGWSTTTKRGKKKKKTAEKPPEVKKAGRQRKVKLRSPKTAAIVLTLQPQAVEKAMKYSDVLRIAKEKVDVRSCGIASLRFRTAATGARILEVPAGDDSAEKADSLAKKLREALGEEVVRVDRPTKCAGFRVFGLDDSVAKEDIAAATAAQAGCQAESVKVGEIRRSQQGTGVALVSCPVAAAKKLGEAGRLLVGWVSARVELLQPRPLRCYRCLETGHVRAQCSSEVDRSNECYRCGVSGHISSSCSETPKCSICAAANKPSAHRLGSKLCTPPKTKRSKASKPPGSRMGMDTD